MNLVLLVNDHNAVSDRTASILSEMGWEVRVADTDDLAFEAMVAFRPTLLIVDIEMRRGSGFKSITMARRLCDQTYILAVSRGDHQDVWADAARICGANDYVIGPISAAKLDAAIREGVEQGIVSSAPSIAATRRR